MMILFLVPGQVVRAETSLSELQSSTYLYLQMIKEGRMDAAEAILAKVERLTLDEEIAKIRNGPYDLNMLIQETRYTLEDEEATREERYNRALTVALYVDAHENQVDPLWDVWRGHIIELIDQTLSTEKPVSNHSLQKIYQLYESILPAMHTSLEKNDMMEVEVQQYALLKQLAERPNENRAQVLLELANVLENIQPQEKKGLTEEPEFIWLMWTVGGLIVITLIYVGWRKYRGESEQEVKSRERDS